MALEWISRDLEDDYAEQLTSVLEHEKARSLYWYLRDVELVGHGLRGMTVLELEDKVTDSPHGLQISWDELVELVRQAEDIHDLVATGHREPVEATIDPAPGVYPGCVAVVEIFDSSTYRVAWNAEAAAGNEG